jgi:ribosomal protein S18 acetylase RimI-like enzyme
MIVRDWRDAAPAAMRDCYERERRHWLAALAWDTTWTWATVEQARVGQGLPGLLAYDAANRLQGWTFSVIDGGICHIGGLVAESEAATRALLGATLDAAAEAGARTAAGFVLDRAPGLAAALRACGFTVEPSQYLSVPLAGGDGRSGRLAVSAEAAADPPTRVREGGQPADHAAQLDAWRDDDLAAAARLLDAAYAGDSGRHFVPDGNWERYATGLVEQAGCGVFQPGLTRVVRGADGLRAIVIVTSISDATAHIAQVAVHPAHRGRGLARRLVERAARDAAAAGRRQLTLLVGDANHAARALYSSLGFTPRATFLSARASEIAACRRLVSA